MGYGEDLWNMISDVFGTVKPEKAIIQDLKEIKIILKKYSKILSNIRVFNGNTLTRDYLNAAVESLNKIDIKEFDSFLADAKKKIQTMHDQYPKFKSRYAEFDKLYKNLKEIYNDLEFIKNAFSTLRKRMEHQGLNKLNLKSKEDQAVLLAQAFDVANSSLTKFKLNLLRGLENPLSVEPFRSINTLILDFEGIVIQIRKEKQAKPIKT